MAGGRGRDWRRGKAFAFDAGKQAAFVAALRRGALVAAAAREAGVAVSTLYWRRQRDPVFAAAWAGAAALSQGAPGRRLRFAGARRRRFLGAFETNCNILWSCATSGVHPATVYRHIGRDAGFERDCRAALARGYVRLEALAARQRAEAAARLRDHDIVPRGTPTADFDEAMRLLARWTRPDGSIGPRFVRRGRQRRWSFEQAIAALDRKLRGIGVRRRPEDP